MKTVGLVFPPVKKAPKVNPAEPPKVENIKKNTTKKTTVK